MASFYGSERYSVDHKGRIALPPDWRRDEEAKRPRTRFFLRPSEAGCLQLYAEGEWAVLENTLRKKMRQGIRYVTAVRQYLMGATWVSVDTQGRITIPSALIARAGLGKEAILHGNIDIIEIWNPKRFDEVAAGGVGGPISEEELLRD